MGAMVERESSEGVKREVFGPRGAKEYQSESGTVTVRGLRNAAEIWQDGSLTELNPEDTPIEVELGSEAKLKISATYDQPDE